MQLFFTVFVMHGGDEHTAGIDTHHRSRRQIGDCNAGLTDQFFRLIILVNSAQNDPISAGSVVQNELQELLGLLHGFAFLDLYGAEIALGEGVKIDLILKQRLNLNIGKINFFFHNGSRLSSLRRSLNTLFNLLVRVQRLHCGDFRDQP